MKSCYAIIGLGPNDLKIPLIMFETEKKALNYIASLKLKLYTKYAGNWAVCRKFYALPFWGGRRMPKRLIEALFKEGRYYGGCGECYGLVVEEVQFGKPMVGWDLD